jgi:hypothetical protein
MMLQEPEGQVFIHPQLDRHTRERDKGEATHLSATKATTPLRHHFATKPPHHIATSPHRHIATKPLTNPIKPNQIHPIAVGTYECANVVRAQHTRLPYGK